jgi:hypothetical protein
LYICAIKAREASGDSGDITKGSETIKKLSSSSVSPLQSTAGYKPHQFFAISLEQKIKLSLK